MRNNSEFYESTHGDSGRHFLTRIRAHAWVVVDPESGTSQVNFQDSSSYVCDEAPNDEFPPAEF